MSSCFTGVTVPACKSSNVLTIKFAPAIESLSNKDPPVSFLSIGTFTTSKMSPVSKPSFICIVVTPLSSSPSITAHCIGAAPRYFGKSDACTLIHPYWPISSISFGRICPKAITTITSISSFFSSSINSGSLTFTG